MSKQQYLECAKIINTHGIRGDVKLECRCDSPEVLCDLERVFVLENGKYIEREVISASVFKNFVIAKIEGIDDVDEAERRKNTILYADRNDFELDEGTYFIADLIGLSVFDDEDGHKYGEICEVVNRGASDIYVIRCEDGKERMIPVVDEFVKEVDLDRGIIVHNIPGLLDGE